MKSVPTAAAAIRGAHPDRSGEAFGVVGTSASADGAGVAAANLDGGPDLVLDGSEDSAPDLYLSQAGAWTSSRTATTFHLANTDAIGAMSLEVEGGVTATALTCPLCVDAADLASGAVTNAKIASSAVTSAKIADGTIQPADVSFNYAASVSQGGSASGLMCTACVSASELNPSGGAAGQVLKHDGTSVVWGTDTHGDLTVPYAGGATSTGTNFYMGNSGTGWAIHAEAAANNAIVGDATANGAGVLGRNMAGTGSGVGVSGMTRSNGGIGVRGLGDISAPDATGVKGQSVGGTGVLGITGATYGVRGETDAGHGVSGLTAGPDTSAGLTGAGVYGETTGSGAGVHGVASGDSSVGVKGENGSTWAALAHFQGAVRSSGAGSTPGAYVESASGYGVHATSGGSGLSGATIYAENDNAGGIAIRASNTSTDATIVAGNGGSGDLMKLFGPGSDLRVRINNAGDISIDGAFNTGGADFAELLPARDDTLEPGDVLAISADGRLMRSVEAYQASVVGVYSTKPGLLGGSPESGDRRGLVPLAVVGVVPVKASDQNGPIRPGDMLVASAVPGHAMRAGDRAPNGRVIGKALSGLERGVGTVTMLVILQ